MKTSTPASTSKDLKPHSDYCESLGEKKKKGYDSMSHTTGTVDTSHKTQELVVECVSTNPSHVNVQAFRFSELTLLFAFSHMALTLKLQHRL